MSAEDIACCLDCQMTFGNHEELTVHSCHQIKAEENSQITKFCDQENFEYELNPKEYAAMDSDYNQRELIKIKLRLHELKTFQNLRITSFILKKVKCIL